MSDMTLTDKERNALICRYNAEGAKLLLPEHKNSEEIKEELREIREKLGMEHEEIAALGADLVFPQFGVHPQEQ